MIAAAATPASPWPYPFWIAHRGAGKERPENTLAAFQHGWDCGFAMFECDVKLSADGVPFLLHDDTLERTSNGVGAADALPWAALVQLDAGSWHSSACAGERLPTLAQVAAFCLARGAALNIEIKPMPGQERATGSAVALAARALWQGQRVPPLLSSFQPAALQAAQQAAPELPRALLLETLWRGWQQEAQRLGCVAIVCQHRLPDAALMQQARAQGWRVLCYTANSADDVQRLRALGVDGLISDEMHWARSQNSA
ncbi:MAG: glycerophosphodiester phosphodiesterase [Pseudomonadota bacterium]|jgi:glycerophosphoryl diester phosphodiesterase